VFGVVNVFNGEKLPGSDGFSMAFFFSLRASFLGLILKKTDVVEVKDFRPSNLVGGMYKIISKVLANHLHRVVYGLILYFQNAFVKG